MLPVFVGYGLALGWLRSRTGSAFPGMVVHGVTYALAVIFTVASAAAAPACERPNVIWQGTTTDATPSFIAPSAESQTRCNPG